MAFTKTLQERTVYGNHQVQYYTVTADGLSDTIATGFNRVVGATLTPTSMTTAAGKVRINQGVSGTAIAGTVAVTGVASGDEFYLTVYGT